MGVSKIPCLLVPQRKILPNQLIQTGVSDVTIIQSLRSGHRRGACFVCYRSVLFRQLGNCSKVIASSGTSSPPLSHGCHAWADWAWVMDKPIKSQTNIYGGGSSLRRVPDLKMLCQVYFINSRPPWSLP